MPLYIQRERNQRLNRNRTCWNDGCLYLLVMICLLGISNTPAFSAHGRQHKKQRPLNEILDTDQDGMPDEWELDVGLDPATDDAGADPDFDGFSNLTELSLKTDPLNADDAFGNLDGLLRHGASFSTKTVFRVP